MDTTSTITETNNLPGPSEANKGGEAVGTLNNTANSPTNQKRFTKKRRFSSSEDSSSSSEDDSSSASSSSEKDFSSDSSSSSDEDIKKKHIKRCKRDKEDKGGKQQRFKPASGENSSNKWKLTEDQAKYVNKFARTYTQGKVIQDSIMESLPVPANVAQVAELDEYIHSSLEEKNNGSTVITVDDELKKIQQNIRNIFGPIGRLWHQVEEIN